MRKTICGKRRDSYCISNSGLFHGKALRQQIQRTLSADRAMRKVMMREKEVCLGLSAGWLAGWTATSSFCIS